MLDISEGDKRLFKELSTFSTGFSTAVFSCIFNAFPVFVNNFQFPER
jgi:hypothetical protein